MDAQSMKPAPQIALIAVTQKGVERARHLRQRLKTGEVYRRRAMDLPRRSGSALTTLPLPLKWLPGLRSMTSWSSSSLQVL